jgi:hypothetical protein
VRSFDKLRMTAGELRMTAAAVREILRQAQDDSSSSGSE